MNDRQHGSAPARAGFDAAMAGKRAECDGGGLTASGHAARQEFAGMLTGEYVDHGEPPWRWYLMVDLSCKPEGYPSDAVWCESESVFLLDDE
jgi:hypothetical protein